MIIKTRKFTLRPYKKGDEKSLTENINDWNVVRYTCSIAYPYSHKIARVWIEKNLRLFKTKNKKEINFAIDVGGEVIGGIGFKNMDCVKAEIGYWLGKKHWGKGIMTEAVMLMTDFGLKKLKFRRIYANVMIPNKASIKVLEKNRYRREGRLKNFYTKDGKLIDVFLYARTK
ncbi:MAG TPA: GNAT family protein [Candidatus Nanoarchaeia archaeon]|nr:GNAT family protein [Candidatus Nanoarchaeia archaeon]